MKLKILFTMIVFLFITGCAVKLNTYKSTASDSFVSSSIVTNFTIIRGKNSNLSYPYRFGVIAANDNQKLKYTLIAPKIIISDQTSSTLNHFQLYHATPINNENLKELIEKLEDAISQWSNKYPNFKGYNVLYQIKGEESKMSFHYQNGQDGSLAHVEFSSGKKHVYIHAPNDNIYETVFRYRIETLNELKGFKELLESSYNENNFGYDENEKPVSWFE